MAYIDYKQIAFCIRTILGNSMDTLADGGAIRINTRLEGDDIVVDITDTGTDISPEAREQLTTPFSATQGLGSGAALPLCKTILDKHGIPFEMESAAEGGTQYIVRLPRRKEET
jgi:signal transduction histidine kinase